MIHYGLGLKGTLALVDGLKASRGKSQGPAFWLCTRDVMHLSPQVNSMITSVRLPYNNIPDEGICALIECLSKSLVTDLNISGNKIGHAGCEALANLLVDT